MNAVAVAVLIITMIFPLSGTQLITTNFKGEPGTIDLSQVDDWLCVYTDVDAEAIAATKFDLVDIDPDAFTTADIMAMKASGKIVIAYISIGEAEEYRYYWNPNASYLLEENPQWEGNWYVDYSNKEWQTLILADYIPKIKAKGFDGLYLDTLEGYYLEAQYPNCSKDNMIDFIGQIASMYHSSQFYIIPQNGLDILNYILDYIDAIGIEETYYRAFYLGCLDRFINGIPQNPWLTANKETLMDTALDNGKMVFTLDYAVLRFQIEKCYNRAEQNDYVPYVSTALLNRIVIHPGHEPD